MTACAGFPTDGDVGATSGNSVQCRIYHGGVAGTSTMNAGIHCPHAGPTGGGVCGTAGDTTTDAATTGDSKSGAATLVASGAIAAAMIALAL